jgi:hypothetical protein
MYVLNSNGRPGKFVIEGADAATKTQEPTRTRQIYCGGHWCTATKSE